MSDRPQKQVSAKAHLSTFGSSVLAISLLMEIFVRVVITILRHHACMHVVAFGKYGHKCNIIKKLKFKKEVGITIKSKETRVTK